MTRLRLAQLLVLAALMLAPFGRIASAEAMAAPVHAGMTGHCGGQPMPNSGKGHRMAVDCSIVCAAMTAPAAPLAPPPAALTAAPVGLAPAFPSGILPQADPPPPRFA